LVKSFNKEIDSEYACDMKLMLDPRCEASARLQSIVYRFYHNKQKKKDLIYDSCSSSVHTNYSVPLVCIHIPKEEKIKCCHILSQTNLKNSIGTKGRTSTAHIE
jgi:hypothetical protein